MKTFRCLIFFTLLFLLAIHPLASFAASINSELGENEVKMGAESAIQIQKELKFSKNEVYIKRVTEIGNKIAAIANVKEVKALYGSKLVTPFEYKFFVVEDKDINAFSIPGGYIYINTGLLDFVQSDQELAGVIAHEVIHASHHHMVYLLKKQASLNNQMALILLASVIGKTRSSDISNILLGTQLMQIAKINGYGMQAERDSDNGAVFYLHEAGYNPVGLLTFLERLAKRPELVEYGIYRSHPIDAERVNAVKKLIVDMDLPLNRRTTTNAVIATTKSFIEDGKELYEVVINNNVIYKATPFGGKTSNERALEVANKINQALDSDVGMYEVRVDTIGGAVTVRNQAIITVTDEDAILMQKTPAQAALFAATAIKEVIWRQMVDTIH